MKKNKKIALFFYLGAIGFYIASAVSFLNNSTNSTLGVVFLCLGSSWVAIGGSLANKDKKGSSDISTEEKDS